MISIANPHPLSMLLFRRNRYFSPKLYLKESYFRRKERAMTNKVLAATGAAGGAAALLAGLSNLHFLSI